MPRLRVSTVVKAPPERVFEYVTGFGKEGPAGQAFEEKHGKILSREGNVFLIREEETVRGRAVEIKWRCSFDYPTRRVMEAVDSSWADRTDLFEPTPEGTRWSIEWRTKIGGLKGLLQLLHFKLKGRRKYSKMAFQATKDHFGGKAGSG